MASRVFRRPRSRGTIVLLLAGALALLAACDQGGAPAAPAATPVPPAPTAALPPAPATATLALVTSTAAPATAVPPVPAATAPATTAPPPTATAAAVDTPPATSTATRAGNPAPGAAWQSLGLAGEELFAVAGTGQAGAPVYVGGNGVYRSADQGATWHPLGFDAANPVEELHVALADPQVIYAGSGADCFGGPAGRQLRSTDAGATWTALPQAPSSLQVDPRDASHLTAMTCGGVVRSGDGGRTWTALPDPGLAAQPALHGDQVRVAAAAPADLYATYLSENGSGRLRASTDGGRTWAGDGRDYPGLGDLLVDETRPDHAWAIVRPGILHTTDSGQTWTPSVSGLDAAHNTGAGAQGVYQLSALTAQYAPGGGLIALYAGSFGTESLPGVGVFRSQDGGLTWTRIGGNLGGRAIHALLVTRAPAAAGAAPFLYAATDDGVHKLALGP